MKTFIKNFFAAIPLSLGVILTIFSVVNALSVTDGDQHVFLALICGVIGMPLLFASIMLLSRKPSA